MALYNVYVRRNGRGGFIRANLKPMSETFAQRSVRRLQNDGHKAMYAKAPKEN
jgi:hypothetical protein